MFEIFDGIPYDQDDEVMRMVMEKGKCRRVDKLDFDDDHKRFIEFWDVDDRTFVTEYDMRYKLVTEVSSDGVIQDVKRCELGKRHLCTMRTFKEQCPVPKEEWVVENRG